MHIEGNSRRAGEAQPRILFIGPPSSTHTHSWIDLLEGAGFDVRLFGYGEAYPPQSWNVYTYLTTPHPPAGLNPATRTTLYRSPEEAEAHRPPRNGMLRRALRAFGKPSAGLSSADDHRPVRAASAEAWLAEVILDWRPDVIHTLGLAPAGLFYSRVRDAYPVQEIGRWVLQLRGGSDLELRRTDPDAIAGIRAALAACDQIVCDNLVNHRYVTELGARAEQLSELNPVPGTGGIDVDQIGALSRDVPSRRRRLILWPKAYERMWSKSVPVLEAIKLAWPELKPAEIYMVPIDEETRLRYNQLPAEIRASCSVSTGIPREEMLARMAEARVMLAPSLVDGVPNCLYEAMAAGAFPVVSPLETIAAVVAEEENVLFARNLYPDQIAAALVRAMNDDALVDCAAVNNAVLVRRVASRDAIRNRVIAYYRKLLT
jgi:glycosyltransferase involved in cell wall biosynthesis